MALPPSGPPAAAPQPAPPKRPGDQPRFPLGLFLAAPAALTALVSLVIPTAQTILRSFQRGGTFRFESGGPRLESEFAGADNYIDVLGSGEFWKALFFSLSLAIVPLVVAVVVAPLLAGALDRGGTWPRRAGRVVMSVPLVVFSPVAIASAWRLGQRDGGIETVFGNLSEPGRAQFAVPLIIGTATFGAVCGLALLAFLAVLRGRAAGRPVLPAAIAVGAIVALATVAVGLQTFSFVFTLTRGGPNRSTQTLAVLQSTRALTLFDFGDGAVVATVTGLILAVLGVGATLIAILAALRIELTPADRAVTDSGDPAAGPVGRPSGPGGTLIAVVALLAVLAVVVAGSWPWLSALFSSSEGPPSAAGARTYVNTWVPPLLGALVSVGTAFLAALGIGGLRPLGRHSEWLLLPFAPWLFVGIGPLSIAGFDNARSLDLINTFPGLVPPLLLSVPALVVLTLFCRGQSARWHALLAAGAPAGPGFLRVVVAPALPLAAFLGGATVLINAQDLLWPLVIGASRDSWTAPLLLTTETGRFAGAGGSVGITTPIVVVVIALIALAALQVFYLDRLAITSDRSAAGTATGAPTPGPAPR